MSIKKVVIAGGGVLGSQIAYQSAYCGFDVTIYSTSIWKVPPRLEALHQTYAESIEVMNSPQGKTIPGAWCNGIATAEQFDYDACVKANEEAPKRIRTEEDLEKALVDCDLLVEAIVEDPQAKIEFFQRCAGLLPEKTIVVTNTSTLPPSMFAAHTGRPEKFTTLHFCTGVHRSNVSEIMMLPETDPQVFDQVCEFAQDIKMIPIRLYKEQPGYIINSLLVPWVINAMTLWASGVSDPETIDKTWSVCFGGAGPFQIVDMVGLMTPYAICQMRLANDPEDPPALLLQPKLEEMIKAGKLGVQSGEGFYKYS